MLELDEMEVLRVTPVRLPVPAGFVVLLVQLPDPWGVMLVLVWDAGVVEAGV
jgi:hypothetical protein